VNETALANAVRQHQAGNLAEAARLYCALLRADPRNFQALYFLGFLYIQEGRFDEAERLIGQAIRINPNSPDAFYNRGCALQNLQRHDNALAAFDKALALKPDYDEALTNRGATLLALKRHAEALANFDRALALKPRDPEALSNRATACFEITRYAEAAADYAKLLAVAPDFPYGIGNLALARAYCCDWRFFAQERARISADIRLGKAVLPPHGATLLLDDPEDQLRCARRWTADRCPPAAVALWRGERYSHEKIRIAYISADFSAHATAFLLAGVFEQHDRNRFEITLVSLGPDDGSEMRVRLMRGCDRFVDTARKSDLDTATLLRNLEIDIAVDLKGFTQDARPGIFAHRPAPVQVNYLGHPGTMGADYIDYILADPIVIPPEQQTFFSEKVVYLPETYQANDSQRRISERAPARKEAGLPQDGFVFCSFNNSFKITPAMFDVWMRLLQAVEGSVLWLLEDNATAVANLQREAEARGVDDSRLLFAARQSPENHLARQSLADLFLDTLPCNAHTTASDALWAGLPLITCIGSSFAGRVAASLLHAIGLPELIAPSLECYEAMALRFARDPAALAQVREKLAENRETHALFDTVRFTRNLEGAFTEMWERYQRGEPAGFAVA